MENSVEIQIGQRYFIIRNLLLLTREQVYQLTGISISTLTRIENGKLPSKQITSDKLSNLYQISKADIYNISKPLPPWKILKRKVLAAHRNNEKLVNFLNEKAEPKIIIEFRVLKSTFLNSYKSAKQVTDNIRKVYSTIFTQSTIKNSLEILVEEGVLETKNTDESPQKFRKAQRIPINQLQAIDQIQFNLEEICSDTHYNLVTPAFDKMAKMLFFLKDGPSKRKDIFDFADYRNASNNIKRSLKILENMKLVEMTVKDKPNSSKQMYRLTEKGRELLRKVGVEVRG